MICRDVPVVPDLCERLPAPEGVRLFAAPIADHTDSLWPAERAAVATAHPRRASEFATARYAARRAMADLGVQPCAIPRVERRPVWPDGVRGSLTHAGELAVAAVAEARSVRGLGVDLEVAERVTERLFPKLFTAAELSRLEAGERRLPSLLFSAKEAGYKAVNPEVGRYIGFHEAEVDLDWPRRTWRLRYVGEHPANRIMERGRGHFCFFDGYVLTLFVIPR